MPVALYCTVFPDYGLDLFDKCVFGVVAEDFESSVVRVLKFLGVSELDDPGRDCNGAVRRRLIKTNFQENPVLQAGNRAEEGFVT